MKKVLLLCFLTLNSCINKVEISNWELYKQLVAERFPNIKNNLQNGTSLEELKKFEKKFNVVLPQEFKALYLENNGETLNKAVLRGYICGLNLLPLDKIEKELEFNRKIWKKESNFNLNWDDEIYPPNTIKKVYYNPKWIPFISDLTGNYIAIDLDPDTQGSYGQVINYGADEAFHYVLGENIDSFFKLVNTYVDENNVNASNLENFGHLTDGLKQLIEKTDKN